MSGAPAPPPPAPRPAGPPREPRDVPLLIGRAAGWLVVLWFLVAAAVAVGLWVVGAVTVDWPAVPLAAGAGALALLVWALLRSRRLAVLVGAAAALAVPIILGVSLGRFDGTAGYRSVAPSAPVELERSYHQATGELELNLSNLKLDPGTTTTLAVDMGAGAVRVIVPWETDVAASAKVGFGRFELFGREQTGFGLSGHVRSAGEPAAPRLEVKTHAGAGRISLFRAKPSPTRLALAKGGAVPLLCRPGDYGSLSCATLDDTATPELTCLVAADFEALCRPTGQGEPVAPWAGKPGTRRCMVPARGGPAACGEPVPFPPPPSSPPASPAQSPVPAEPGSYLCTVPPDGGAATCRPA
jgi:hypothetical protein